MVDAFIHLFTTPGGYYLYDVNKNAILSLSEDQYVILNNYQKGNKDSGGTLYSKQAIESFEHLYSLGFLSTKRPKEMYHPISDALISHLNNKVKMITLQITRRCNLRCKYCVYSGNYETREHSNDRMSLEMAKKGIDFLIEHSKDNERVFLALYGGEPLIEFEFIKECIEYYEEKAEGKKSLLTLTTNATLITEEIIDYFQKHNLYLLISLDGPSEIHNKNRVYGYDDRGTFEKIMENLDMIKERFPDYINNYVSFNAVLDPQNAFGCINDFFTDFESAKESNLNASEVAHYYKKEEVKVSETYIYEMQYEYFKLFLSKIGHLDKKYTSKLVWRHYNQRKDKYNRMQLTAEIPDKTHHGGPCVPGVQRLFMNVEGNFYPCERVSETSQQMRIGNVDTGFDTDKIKTLLNIGKVSEKNCNNCWALRFCNLCAAAADDHDNLSMEKKISNCSSVKRSVEDLFKDICTLREFGDELKEGIYAFDNTDWRV